MFAVISRVLNSFLVWFTAIELLGEATKLTCETVKDSAEFYNQEAKIQNKARLLALTKEVEVQ